MEVEKRIHSVWNEWNSMSQDLKDKLLILGNMFGKHQYIYSSSKGRISLVHMVTGLSDTKVWEIYCLSGDLFEDVERFKTKKNAVKRIRELMK